MFKKLFIITTLTISIFWFALACASLTIQITQGVDKPYPIAIVPFNKSNDISNIITNDLKTSGRFSFLPTMGMPEKPHSLKNFNWNNWKNTKVEYVVLGKIQKNKQNYNVNLYLLSLIGNTPLISQKFNNIHKKDFRALAHHFSDMIYHTITGIPGIFSTRIAYVQIVTKNNRHHYQLMVADADGHNPHLLIDQTTPIATPKWSPDGTKIAYVSYHNDRMTIYTINVLTGKRTLITHESGINSAPAWSPDGKKLAMALSTRGSDKTNLYIFDIATHKLTQLTALATNTSPCFSPDGDDIAFTSNRDGSPQIFILDIESGKIKRLTYDGVQNFTPLYTRDGQNIVMMNEAEHGGPIRIATINLASEETTILTNGQLDKSPSVAPNGEMIIYANYDNPRGLLKETSIDGRIQLQLPTTTGSVQSPAWGPLI